jgi:hypothetical protein
MPRPARPLIERYLEKVPADLPVNVCWPWQGMIHPKTGYGYLIATKPEREAGASANLRAHRVGWVFHNGPIPDGLWVLHRCDYPRCINPEHWFLGTHADNMLDKLRKGRQPKWTENGNAKLTIPEVQLIRRVFQEGYQRGLFAALGRDLDISADAVRRICLEPEKYWRGI